MRSFSSADTGALRDRRPILKAMSTGPGLRDRDEREHWISQEKILWCMLCRNKFTPLRRRHHCRACGHVICFACSCWVEGSFVFHNPRPKERVRVCSTCSVSTIAVQAPKGVKAEDDEPPKAIEDAMQAIKDAKWTAYASAKGPSSGLCVGVLEVVVVQGLGLPAGDRNGLSDPYAKLCLTGLTSAGQEWCAELRTGRETSKRYSTLSPVWNEQLFFKVPRAGGVLRLQVYDWDLAASDDLLGSAEVPLSSLLHGKRVEQWLELRGEDGEPKGQVQVVMHYTFNRWGEALSRYWPEQEYVPDWPGFSPSLTYSNLLLLLAELWPYVAFASAAVEVLSWQRPLVSLWWLVALVFLSFRPRFLLSFLQACLLVHMAAWWQRRRKAARKAAADPSCDGCPTAAAQGSEAAEAHKAEHEAQRQSDSDGSDEEEEAEKVENLNFFIEYLGRRLGRMDATTNIQNYLGMVASLLATLRGLFDFSSPPVSSAIFAVLAVSTVFHLFVSPSYFSVAVIVFLFVVMTPPYKLSMWSLSQTIANASMLSSQLAWHWSDKPIPGEVVDSKPDSGEHTDGPLQ